MGWTIEEKGNAVVVTMTSSKVNVMNDEFITDFHETFDRLDREFSDKPVILTGQGSTFSAGLDFNYVFPMFARGDKGEINGWFDRFRKMIMRVFNFERPIVAAMNGHAFAGGLILALCCDYRIGVEGQANMSLNEVAIGIPMPHVYVEVVRYVLGCRAAEEVILTGKVYGVKDAQELGLVDELVDPSGLLGKALDHVNSFSPDIFPAYAYSKKGLRAPTMQRIDEHAIQSDREVFPEILSSEESVKVQTQTLTRLKNR